MRLLLVFFIFFTFPLKHVNAQTTEDRRRIEEEKREIIRPGESPKIKSEKYTEKKDSKPQEIFFQELLEKNIATLSDAYAVITILTGYDDRYQDFSAQADFLEKNSIVPSYLRDVSRNPDLPLRKGDIAYMFCKILKIKGGIWMRLFGPNIRYSLKELIYEEIIMPGASSEFVSGKELIFTTTEAANFLAKEELAEVEESKKDNNIK